MPCCIFIFSLHCAILSHKPELLMNSLERTPPILTLEDNSHPIHSFLGFDPDKHIISMRLRDTSDMKELPANGKDYVSARCIRGVRKVSLMSKISRTHPLNSSLPSGDDRGVAIIYLQVQAGSGRATL